jgi:hypothetical protein
MVIDEAMWFAVVTLLARKRDAPTAAVRHSIMWYETQTDLRAQQVRHDCEGEYMVGEILRF